MLPRRALVVDWIVPFPHPSVQAELTKNKAILSSQWKRKKTANAAAWPGTRIGLQRMMSNPPPFQGSGPVSLARKTKENPISKECRLYTEVGHERSGEETVNRFPGFDYDFPFIFS